jgi:Domain of unknown function (DUF5666)
MNTQISKNSLSQVAKLTFTFMLVALIALAAGCGGGGSSVATGASPTPTPAAGTSSTQVRFGDAPADSVIAFEVSVSSLSLTPAAGGAPIAVAVPAANRIELTHASGKFEPFVAGNLPQGTFSSANLTLVNSELTFLSGTGTPVHINGPASASITVPLSPNLTISGPLVLNIDVNVAASITTVGGVVNGIAFTPASFNITAKAPGVAGNQQDDDGEIEDVQGTVTAVNGSSFTLKIGGSSLTFATDGTTQFKDGVTTVAGLLNQVVTVEGFTRADGSLFAKEVEGLESNTGAEVEGLITAISGTTLTVNAHDGIGNGFDDTKIGATFSVNIAGLSASKFRVKAGNGFGGGLPSATFPFDATTIHQGQRIEVDTNAAVPPANGAISPDKINLQQQGVSGPVANKAAGTFDINLATDSALRIISGQTVVHVTTNSSTDSRVSVANGSAVQVRGLLFWNGTSWQMIARRIR